MEFVDSHVHFWNVKHKSLRWDWLRPEVDHPLLGNIDAIKSVAFEAKDLRAEARFTGLTQAVHVQAAIGSPDPVEETRWLTDMWREFGMPNAIVAFAPIGSNDFGSVLAEHLESPLMRGVRDFALEGLIASGDSPRTVAKSMTLLAEENLVVDLDCEAQNMKAAAKFASAYPDVQFVVDHIGYPRSRDAEYFRSWKQGISDLARADNMSCKISGVAMTDPNFTIESLSPWVHHCLESFGVERCMLGSNWPVDRLRSSYATIFDTYENLLAELSPSEVRQVATGTARSMFRIPDDDKQEGEAP